MRILVATDGTLDPDRAAKAVARWHREGDKVTVFTAINVPTHLLSTLAERGVSAASTIALEAGQGFTAGDRAAERLTRHQVPTPGARSDSPVMQALGSTAKERMKPVVKALRGRGIEARTSWTTTDNQTARSIVNAVRAHDIGLLVIGSHGYGRFEGKLGSTGTKLVRHSPASVLIIRDDGVPEKAADS